MFIIPMNKQNEFRKLYETQRVNVAAIDVFYQNIRLLNNHWTMLNRDMYLTSFKESLDDIELVTSPLESIIPCNDNTDKLFVINAGTPEYEEISKRMTPEHILELIPGDSEIAMVLKNRNENIVTILDDICISFYIYKYLDQIEKIHDSAFASYSPVIDYVMDNMSVKDFNDFLTSRKLNEQKFIDHYINKDSEKYENVIFNLDIATAVKFYSEGSRNNQPIIDVNELMIRLATNIVVKSDTYIILAVFMILFAAMPDFINMNIEDSKTAKYVVDVISKIKK